MATRHLYIARHGDADAFGTPTKTGRIQAGFLGQRLAHLPISTIWHSPLARAATTAQMIGAQIDAPVAEAPELIDHVPYVPSPDETPQAWRPFFDGYDVGEAAAGNRLARSMVARFASAPSGSEDVHEVLVTHSYPIAWLVREALGARPVRWLGMNSANTGLTVIHYGSGQPATLVMFNDLSHLPPELRWTGFPDALRA